VIHDTTDYGKGHNKYFSQYIQKAGADQKMLQIVNWAHRQLLTKAS